MNDLSQAPEKVEPPAYADCASTAPLPASSDTSPPAYDVTNPSTRPGAAGEKQRHAPTEGSTNDSSRAGPSSAPGSRSDISHTSWHLTPKTAASSTLVVKDASDASSPPLYYVHRSDGAPQIRLQCATTGREIGRAHYLPHSREVEIDFAHSGGGGGGARGVELRPVGNDSRSYAYSSPTLMRRLRWTRHGLWGHHLVTGMECRDERGDEVAAWSMRGRLSASGRVAGIEFARWVEAGADEAGVRARKEEILLLGWVMHFKKSVAGGSLHRDAPERDMRWMTAV